VLPEREGLELEGNSWDRDEGGLSSVEAEWVGACERERLGCVQPREGKTDREEEKENGEVRERPVESSGSSCLVGLWGAGLWWPREGPLVSLPREGQWLFERKPAEGRGSSVCRRKGALGSIESKMGLRGFSFS
jgi:hypothetical protein